MKPAPMSQSAGILFLRTLVGLVGLEAGSGSSWAFNPTLTFLEINNDKGALSEKMFKDFNLKHAYIFNSFKLEGNT